MIDVSKTIVNTKRMLIGFMLKGPGDVLGDFHAGVVEKPFPLNILRKNRFKSKNIAITDKGVVEIGDFRINNLPMCVYINNNFIDIDNGMSLIGKYVNDDKIVGFKVKFGDGSIANYSYRDVIKLSMWFKPINFLVRSFDNGSKYICGKPGVMRLEDLPTYELGASKSKEVGNVVKESRSSVEKSNDVDIIDIYSIIDRFNGIVINLPEDKYVSNTGSIDTGMFNSLELGEFAYPRLKFNESMLNANTTFRKPGVVNIQFNDGNVMPIKTYVFSTKHIFVNADNYMKSIGVGIPIEYKDEFIKALGKGINISTVENNRLKSVLEYLTNKNNLILYKLDLSKVKLLSDSKLDDFILDIDKLYNYVVELFTCKVLSKYTSSSWGLIKDLKKTVDVKFEDIIGKKPVGIFANMDDETLKILQGSGIDIYTGAYKFVGKGKPKGLDSNKKYPTIDYFIDGYDIKKWTYSKIREAGLDGKGLPKSIIDVIQKIESKKNVIDKIITAYNIGEKASNRADEIIKILWLHKCAMYVKGNRASIHGHDRDLWELDNTSRRKANVYTCKDSRYEGLKLALNNINLG